MPDADRSGRGQPERHHEGHAGEVERHLVRRKRDGIDATGQRRHGAEHTHFRHELRGGWSAQPKEPREPIPLDLQKGHVEQAHLVGVLVAEDHQRAATPP